MTPDCIYVKEIDFKNDTITIEVDGFEKIHLETLGLNLEAQMDSIIKQSIKAVANSARSEVRSEERRVGKD